MNSDRLYELEQNLAHLVGRILRSPGETFTTETLAEEAGFDRSHWCTLFRERVGESPGSFIRRIRMEMARHRIAHTSEPIDKIAVDCGYHNLSAFCRAFRRFCGSAPREFRHSGIKPNQKFDGGIHWNSTWDEPEPDGLARRFPFRFTIRPAVRIAAVQHIGSYSLLGEAYAKLAETFPAEFHNRHFFTVYWDNLWTHPADGTMRSTIGFALLPNETPPSGLVEFIIPGGRYVRIERAIRRTERHDGWLWMTRKWPDATISMDEHSGIPLPWKAAETIVWTGTPVVRPNAKHRRPTKSG